MTNESENKNTNNKWKQTHEWNIKTKQENRMRREKNNKQIYLTSIQTKRVNNKREWAG